MLAKTRHGRNMTAGQTLEVELPGNVKAASGAALEPEKEQIRRCGKFQGCEPGSILTKKRGADFVRPPSGLLRFSSNGDRACYRSFLG